MERGELDAGDVLFGSLRILRDRPILILPQLVTGLPLLLLGLLSSEFRSVGRVFDSPPSSLILLIFLVVIISGILGIVVAGIYPVLVRDILTGDEPDIGSALGSAFGKFWSLLGAGVLVSLIVGFGMLLLVVPGVIFLTWYFYTVPAIMLEDRGALDGMRASKRFGRIRKAKTFVILLVIFVLFLVIASLATVGMLVSPLGSSVISYILGIGASSWLSVIPAYAYVRYGLASTSTKLFCSGCGVEMPPKALFCPSCGRRKY